MATKGAVGGFQVCLVCLETHDVLKVVPTCKHVFCKKCLSTHLQALVEAKGSFPCPTCQLESPIEGNDVDALLDYNGSDEVGAVAKTERTTKCERPKVRSNGNDQSKIENATCRVCRFTKKSNVEAENLCEQCGNIYLCKECTIRHGKNKTTKDHIVITVRSMQKRAEAYCKIHDELIISYCVTCSKSVCQLCVLIAHENHDISKFGEVFRSLLDDVKAAKTKQEERSAAILSMENDLKFMKSFNIDTQGILIQQVEGHAEKCIDQIIKDKETAKERIRDNFKMTEGVSGCLDRVPTVATRVATSLVRATRLLSEAEAHPTDLEQLALVRDEMMESGKLVEGIDGDGYWEAFERLWSNVPRFVPNKDNYSFGTLDIIIPKDFNIDCAKLVFEKKLEVDNEANIIPCVTNLGNDLYAVAQPTIQGQPSDAVDIYKFPGEFKQTIRNHVPPLYDMAATPLGKLAVLSDGTKEGTCSVRLFDPETGYNRSTKDFPVRHPLSFDINLRHQYVILHSDGGKRINIFNEDGSVEVTHATDEVNDIKDASRIACSARYIYVNGIVGQKGAIAWYKQKGKQLLKVTVINPYYYNYKDITAGLFGGIAVCFRYANHIYVHTYVDNNNQLICYSGLDAGSVAQKADIESRLSIRDNNYIVSSWGHSIKIFKWE